MDRNANGERKSNIQIVDDNPGNLNILARMLKEHGYDVRMAITGELALKCMQSNTTHPRFNLR